MVDLVESRLRFMFDTNNWTDVISFDKHVDYKRIERCIKGTTIELENEKITINGTQGIDILGVFQNNNLYLVEIKNYKNYRISNKDKLENSAELLATSVGRKVRDSIACIVSGKRNSTNDKDLWERVLDILCNQRKNIFVILWLEEDFISLDKEKIKLYNYQKTLQGKLKWLTNSSNIRVWNKRNYPDNINLNVEYE